MARKAPIITMDEFKEKILAVASKGSEDPEESGMHSLVYDLCYGNNGRNAFYDDVHKIDFDFENYYTPGNPEDEASARSDSYVSPEEKGAVGFNVLPSGIPFLGAWAGGDWEHPVYFIAYWDGKTIRGYVPTAGNTFNTKYKTAFGSEENSDDYDRVEHEEWVQKTFGVPFIDFEGDEQKYITFNAAAFVADANDRIQVRT